MSFDPPESLNPFAAPTALIGEQARYRDVLENDAELIRREHFGREANVQSLGHLYYLGAFFGVVFVVFSLLMATGAMPIDADQGRGVDPTMQRAVMGFSALFYLVVAGLCGAVGFGLTRLQAWARWMAVTLLSINLLMVAMVSLFLLMMNPVAGLITFALGAGVLGLILALLISSKTGMVFSAEYREVIRQTPQVRHRASLLVKILLVVIIALFGAGAMVAIVGALNR